MFLCCAYDKKHFTVFYSRTTVKVVVVILVPEAVVVGLVLHDGVGWKVQNSS